MFVAANYCSRRVRSAPRESAGIVFVVRLLSDLRRATSSARHADAMFVHEFTAGLALVEKCASRDDRGKQEGHARPLKLARQLEHHAPCGENQKRVHEALAE